MLGLKKAILEDVKMIVIRPVFQVLRERENSYWLLIHLEWDLMLMTMN